MLVTWHPLGLVATPVTVPGFTFDGVALTMTLALVETSLLITPAWPNEEG